MSSRLWYPQLDVFDTARRMCILLHFFRSTPGFEKLCIVDFYLANPPLLHKTQMSLDVRKKFSELSINKPEKSFISYPSAPLLFHKMEPIQQEAIKALTSKGLIVFERLKQGYVELSAEGKRYFPLESICSDEETKLSDFLANSFANIEQEGNFELRRRTGLRRVLK
jgi:hypothetical protein